MERLPVITDEQADETTPDFYAITATFGMVPSIFRGIANSIFM